MLDDLIRGWRAKRFSDADIIDMAVNEGFDEDEVMAALSRLPRPAAAAPQKQARFGGRAASARDCRPDLLKAPYRFVALNEKVAVVDPTPHDVPLKDGLCATIELRWVAETPLLIGKDREGGVGPLRLWDGDDAAPFAVPGSSLRGMLRSAMEIVAFGRLHRVNGHHRYGLRDFEHPEYRNIDGQFPLSQVEKVQAGWLSKIGEAYQITPCQWAQVEITAMVGAADAFAWTNKGLEDKYRHFQMDRFDFSQTRRFTQVGDRNGKAVVRPDTGGGLEGVYVFSDKVPNNRPETWEKSGKKVEYVFHGPKGKPVRLEPETMAQFRRSNSKPSRNKSEPTGSWKKLEKVVDAGKPIPVFYIGDLKTQGDNFAFGLTRLFKVPHKNSVGQLVKNSGAQKTIPRSEADGSHSGVDFVENLFGYVLEEGGFDFDGDEARRPKAIARKGRIAFSFGQFEDGCAVEQQGFADTVMMGARASFAPFYLSGETKDYGNDKAKLAGRKRYLPRYPGGSGLPALSEDLRRQLPTQGKVKDNDAIRTHLKFLLPAGGRDLCFTSTIRLHNVSRAELGAVLWVITHGGDTSGRYRHMIGRAKPFGAGQMRVEVKDLSLLFNDPAKDAVTTAEIKPFLDAFEALMAEKVGRDWRGSPQIGEFLATSDPSQGKALAESGKLGYLSELKDFGTVRKMTKRLASEAAPCPPFDRYLITPRDGKGG